MGGPCGDNERMTTYAIIMAGGSGTRFWPLSRRARPKQFLAIGTESPLIVETVERLVPLIPTEHLKIVAGESHVAGLKSHLPMLGPDALIVEPCARNTAPCIGLAAINVAQDDPDAVMVVLPADHHIADGTSYRNLISAACERARQGDIVTLGIHPTRPETGYGYIELDANRVTNPDVGPIAFDLNRFVEKPDVDTARKYLESKHFVWNSGMFFFTAKTILGAFERHLPDMHEGLMRIADHIGSNTYPSARISAQLLSSICPARSHQKSHQI